VLEASACGLRWIVDTLREGGVPVRKFVATGGLPHHNPLFIQICADVLGHKIVIPSSKQGPALGAAILGALAGEAFPDAFSAIRAVAGRNPSRTVVPRRGAVRVYDRVYSEYRALAEVLRQNSL
jgi:L-ribulokinase